MGSRADGLERSHPPGDEFAGPGEDVAPPASDRRGRLGAAPFAYRASKDGRVFISWRGRRVTVLRGAAAAKFLAKIVGGDERQAQLLMARATGHFKHGNER